MAYAHSRPVLRLVNDADAAGHQSVRRRTARSPDSAVARENRAAAALAPSDARSVLAFNAASALQGGRAAAIAPDARRRLIDLATSLGLRPFDANLIIAIVQDAARSGRPVPFADRAILPSDAADRIALLPDPAPGNGRPADDEPHSEATLWSAFALAVILALGIATTVAAWIAL